MNNEEQKILDIFNKDVTLKAPINQEKQEIITIFETDISEEVAIEEQEDVINKKKDKEVLKGEMAHLNICSNKRLLELNFVDVAARAYDEGLTALLPDIYSQLPHNND